MLLPTDWMTRLMVPASESASAMVSGNSLGTGATPDDHELAGAPNLGDPRRIDDQAPDVR